MLSLLPLIANVGTPLMWVTMFHLALGNFFIGLFEWWLLQRFFPDVKWRALAVLILSNYVSAWVGLFLLQRLGAGLEVTIVNLRFWFTVFAVGAFFATLLIEFPFFWIALRPRKRVVSLAAKATLLVHIISYIFLFGGYWLVSGTSMMTRLKVIPAAELLSELGSPGYSIYYLTPDGKKIMRLNTATGEVGGIEVGEAPSGGENIRLVALKGEESAFDLHLLQRGGTTTHQSKVHLIQKAFTEQAGLQQGEGEKMDHWVFQPVGKIASLAATSEWTFFTGYWPSQGISGKHEASGTQIRYAVETPYQQWLVQFATHLEGDRLIFQLGEDQICLLDPFARKIALLARGKGPLVALPKPER